MKYIIICITDSDDCAKHIVGVADAVLTFDKDNDIPYYLNDMIYHAENLLIYTDKETEE